MEQINPDEMEQINPEEMELDASIEEASSTDPDPLGVPVILEDVQENVPEGENPADDSDVCTLTLNEVLQIQEDLIEDTAAVLGAANDKTCSYNDGYIKRQALYSCLTCIPEAKKDATKRAGVCLACSYHCHDGHELVELYTKRNFRCDCGTDKFKDFKCNLNPNKSDLNVLNSYNQNFSGEYCVCHRPYPDPEDPLPDEMIQCIVCEDWYHSRHLGVPLPTESFAEMICESCVKQHEFLLNYNNFCQGKLDKFEDPDLKVDVVNDVPEDVNTPEIKTSENEENKKECQKPQVKSDQISAKFYNSVSWRKELCTCSQCVQLYKDEGVLFLTDSDDPVNVYEERGRAKTKEIIENQESNFMKSMNRVQLIDAIAGYNDLKENLANYLKKFAENKTVVREEDIKEFFEGMNARKKQRVEVQHFCR